VFHVVHDLFGRQRLAVEAEVGRDLVVGPGCRRVRLVRFVWLTLRLEVVSALGLGLLDIGAVGLGERHPDVTFDDFLAPLHNDRNDHQHDHEQSNPDRDGVPPDGLLALLGLPPLLLQAALLLLL
jgi:hypothetical protein